MERVHFVINGGVCRHVAAEMKRGRTLGMVVPLQAAARVGTGYGEIAAAHEPGLLEARFEAHSCPVRFSVPAGVAQCVQRSLETSRIRQLHFVGVAVHLGNAAKLEGSARIALGGEPGELVASIPGGASIPLRLYVTGRRDREELRFTGPGHVHAAIGARDLPLPADSFEITAAGERGEWFAEEPRPSKPATQPKRGALGRKAAASA